MAYSHDGEGLHRCVDPADGRHYLYAMSFLDAAPRIFACFDQPDLKAPYTLAVTAPAGLDRSSATRPATAGRARALGARARPRRCRRTSSRWSPARTTRCATSTTASRSACTAAQSLARAPRRGRRRALHGHRAVLRRVPPAVRRSATRSATTTRRSCRSSTPARWRTRAASPSATRSSSGSASPTPSASDRASTIAHEMAHMWFGDLVTHALVGRPLAQRVLRRVHGLPGHRRGHRVRPTPGPTFGVTPQGLGPRRRPAPVHPPGRRQRRGRRRRGACTTSTASPTPRAPRSCKQLAPTSATRCSSPVYDAHFGGTVRQRDAGRSACRRGPTPAPRTSTTGSRVAPDRGRGHAAGRHHRAGLRRAPHAAGTVPRPNVRTASSYNSSGKAWRELGSR